MLRLRLIGEIAADIDGEAGRSRPVGRGRCSRWLALRPGPQPRTTVASVFWPDVLDDSARASLRSALWVFRRALGEDALVATRDRVGLAPQTWVDVLEAERLRVAGHAATRRSRSSRAHSSRGSTRTGRSRRRRNTANVSSRCSRSWLSAAERDGDLRRAVALTRRQAALEPLSEEIHRALMRRLDAAGDRGTALAEYTELRSRLVTRLRTGPSRETQQLAEELREGVAAAPPSFPVRLLRADRTTFVGRNTELARIEAAWRRVSKGGGAAQVVLLAGEAGIGKSRLTARFAAEASAAGATVLYGACEEQSLVPYAPFSEAIGGKAPEREEIEEYLTSAAASGPLVLALDDLHLADRNTLALLARVARGAAGDRLIVLGAYRDADAVGTPLLAAIADLRRDCDVERVAVEGLSVDEVGGAARRRRRRTADPRPHRWKPVLRPRARPPPRRATRRRRRRPRERQRRRAGACRTPLGRTAPRR